MAESTFLSRSFGDQGVRLRIRKETRTLLFVKTVRPTAEMLIVPSKRPAPASIRPEEFSQPFAQNLRQEQSSAPAQQLQYPTSSGYEMPTARDYSSEYGHRPNKRQRTTVTNGTGSYERETYIPRSYTQPQSTYNLYSGQNPTLSNNPVEFGQAPVAQSSGIPDFTFRSYSLPESSSTISSYASPRTQMPTYGTSTQQPSYQPQQTRYTSQTHSQGQYTDLQTAAVPRLAQPVPINRHSNAADQLQSNTAITYTGLPTTDPQSSIQTPSTRRSASSVRDDLYQFPQQMQSQLQSPDQFMRAPPQPLDRYTMSSTSSNNLLPPLQSTVANVQPHLATSSAYSSYIQPDTRILSQQMPPPTPQDNQDRYTGYTSSTLDLEGRRNIHEPG
jgi:hypothetical protein